jgi:hypothetical protein
MPNLITSFADALAADLAGRFPDCDVLRGERTGKAVDKAKIAVYWPGSSEVPSRVQEGQANVVVRYWPITAKVNNQATNGVRDPRELEQAGWDLQDFLQTKQTAYVGIGVWFCRLTAVDPDYDPEEWGVQATVTLQFLNPATL